MQPDKNNSQRWYAPRSRTCTVWLLLVTSLAIGTGCAVLNRENAHLSTDGRLVGRIDNYPATDRDFGQIRVVLWRQNRSHLQIESITRPSPSGIFAFLVRPVADDIGLWVHEDSNGNARFDPGEASWIDLVTDQIFDQSDGLQKTLQITLKPRFEPSKLLKKIDENALSSVSSLSTSTAVPIIFGERVSMDDVRLASSAGPAGLWLPAVAMRKTGLGIYFLEKFDTTRKPVVFVHGAGGSAQDFRPLIDSIDKSVWQIWIYVYPSGIRLDAAANALARILEGLQRRFGAEPVSLVAHSMGGLVARAALLHLQEESKQSIVANLVTVATPWGGHPAAWYGVQHAPVVLPSWRDMLPQSKFLKNLEVATTEIPHLLIYGEKSRQKFYLPLRNDGTIGVDSAAHSVFVDRAVAVDRFELGHGEIIRSADVGERIMNFLDVDQSSQ